MQLEDFKIAALRVFYDIVNSDGIIDDNEILFLEKLKKSMVFYIVMELRILN